MAAVIKEHDNILDFKPRSGELANTFENTAAGDQNVIHYGDAITWVELTFNHSPGAMGFNFLARIEKRFVQLQREPCGRWQ